MAPPRGRRLVRLDQLLVERGLAEHLAQAQALVLSGRVASGGRRLDKPGARLAPGTPVDVTPGKRWVSRGGDKLEGALGRLGVDIAGRRVLDVGASTGGFTQVLLEAGALAVLAVDVGCGQLDWKLRQDPRVRVLEGLNARYLRPEDLPFAPSLAVVDVSFISLERVLPAIFGCLESGGDVLALVKPQFEVNRSAVGPGGIVTDPDLHRQVLRRLADYLRTLGGSVRGLIPSCLRGAEGNLEFFLWIAPATGGLSEAQFDALLERVLREECS